MYIITNIETGESYYSMSLIEICGVVGLNIRTFYRYYKDNTLVKHCRDKGLIFAEGKHLKSGKGGKRYKKYSDE